MVRAGRQHSRAKSSRSRHSSMVSKHQKIKFAPGYCIISGTQMMYRSMNRDEAPEKKFNHQIK